MKKKLMKFHYWLMANPRFWSLTDLRALDSFVCVLASDIGARKFDARKTFKRLRGRFLLTLFREIKDRKFGPVAQMDGAVVS